MIFIFFTGCYKQQETKMITKNTTIEDNSPGRCFQTCGVKTTLVALYVSVAEIHIQSQLQITRAIHINIYSSSPRNFMLWVLINPCHAG